MDFLPISELTSLIYQEDLLKLSWINVAIASFMFVGIILLIIVAISNRRLWRALIANIRRFYRPVIGQMRENLVIQNAPVYDGVYRDVPANSESSSNGTDTGTTSTLSAFGIDHSQDVSALSESFAAMSPISESGRIQSRGRRRTVSPSTRVLRSASVRAQLSLSPEPQASPPVATPDRRARRRYGQNQRNAE